MVRSRARAAQHGGHCRRFIVGDTVVVWEVTDIGAKARAPADKCLKSELHGLVKVAYYSRAIAQASQSELP